MWIWIILSLLAYSTIVICVTDPPGLPRGRSCWPSNFTTCVSHRQCCADRCNSANNIREIKCTEEDNRVRTALCLCKQAIAQMTPLVSEIYALSYRDVHQYCRESIGNSRTCDDFEQCCNSRCRVRGSQSVRCAANTNPVQRIESSECKCVVHD